MMNTQQPNYLADALWRRIADYPIDDPNAAKPLSVKLAEEQGWRPAFTARVLEEYKRFVYLCCISPTGASPSQIVDEAWHMHLTYTTNYWQRFCRDTLQQELHHHPSMGGPEEYQKHRQWYFETLRLYLDTFGEYPPEDIWPGAALVAESSQEPDIRRQLNPVVSKTIYVLLAIPFLFITLVYKQPDPFRLMGKHFLVFFFILCAIITTICTKWVTAKSKLLADLLKDQYDSYNRYEKAYLTGDNQRTALLMVVELVESGAITIMGERTYLIHPYRLTDNSNPLTAVLAATGQDTIDTEVLKGLAVAAAQELPTATRTLKKYYNRFFSLWVLPVVALILAIVRMVQGALNDKPISLLIVLSLFFVLTVSLLHKAYTFHEICKRIVRMETEIPPGHDAPIADLVIVYGIASVMTLQPYQHMKDMYNNSNYGGSCGGGCNSGGCGGGGCGGGCGGCGGS